MVFKNGLINGDIYIYPRLTPVAMATKFRRKLAITRLVWEISARFFVPVGEFSEMGQQMPLNEFYPDQHLLPWQQNLRQNGLYLGLYNKYHQDPCIWRMWGLRVWQLDDVSRSLPQPTLISMYNEQQRIRSSSSSRHIQSSVPDRKYTALP